MSLRSVGLTFPSRDGDREILRDVTFDVRAGEFVCVVGASGSGKTTLLRCLAGLLPLTTGSVLIDGTAISGPNAASSFVFQSDALLPWRRVEDNVALGLEVRGVAADERRRKVQEVLEVVRLGEWGRAYPGQLSGGMRQRVNIARALAQEPSILLMDEPFGALDAQTREVMQDELATLATAGGWTVVFVTHQIDEAVFLGDRVVVLGANPGGVREIVSTPHEGMRQVQDKQTPEFVAKVDHIWGLIRDDVRLGVRAELDHH